VQRISSELRPSMLDDLGLIAALESEAQLFEERSGIECETSLPEEPPELDVDVSTAIYRMVQEALTNVARHSNATRVELRMSTASSTICCRSAGRHFTDMGTIRLRIHRRARHRQ